MNAVRYDANLSMLFTEVPLLQRAAAAVDPGGWLRQRHARQPGLVDRRCAVRPFLSEPAIPARV